MRNGDELLAALRRTVQRGLEQYGVDPQDVGDFLCGGFWDTAPFEELMLVVEDYGLEVDVYLGSKYGF
jgi:hypothetical protein